MTGVQTCALPICFPVTICKAVYAMADKLGIERTKVYFTNGKLKWQMVKQLGIDIHYDNNQNEIDNIEQKTKAVGIKF